MCISLHISKRMDVLLTVATHEKGWCSVVLRDITNQHSPWIKICRERFRFARATNQSKIWKLWLCESLAEICTNTVHELILKEKENPSSTWPLIEYAWNIDFDWKFILSFVKCTGGSCPQVELLTSWKCSLSELYSYLWKSWPIQWYCQ